MKTYSAGVAISTTGDEHRLPFLETSAQSWWKALAPLGLPTRLFVTVDGDEAATLRVAEVVAGFAEVVAGFAEVLQVGQGRETRDGRQGVAVNKNTGIELLMDAGVEHLFLSDDDTRPLFPHSITKHIEFEQPHSMVCWGKNRLALTNNVPSISYAEWSWPRGVMLYTHRPVVLTVGGMDERFGPGGHEHVEWSRRIHQAGFTPVPFITPASYATRAGMGARALWHCEDMPRPGEPLGNVRLRRRRLTSVRRQDGDWERIEQIMADCDGDTTFVPFRAKENGRLSATIAENLTSRGAGGEK